MEVGTDLMSEVGGTSTHIAGRRGVARSTPCRTLASGSGSVDGRGTRWRAPRLQAR